MNEENIYGSIGINFIEHYQMKKDCSTALSQPISVLLEVVTILNLIGCFLEERAVDYSQEDRLKNLCNRPTYIIYKRSIQD